MPVDAGNLAGLLISILKSCEKASLLNRSENNSRLTGVVIPAPKTRKKPAFQFVIEQQSDLTNSVKRTVGVSIAEASHADHAILIVDGRDPLRLADAGQACLEKLKSYAGRFSLETLDFEQYATLDALEAVVGLARSGDLEALLPNGQSRPVTEAEVYESHHRNQRYLRPPVLCQLVGKCTPAALPTVPQIDLQRVLEAISSQLEMNSNLTTLQLVDSWLEQQQPRPDEHLHAAVHNTFKEVVLKLHAEGKVFATALNDYYTIQPAQKQLETIP